MAAAVPLAVIAALVALNAFFVAAEFAIVGVPRASIERLAGGGHRGARAVQRIVHDPRRLDRYVATAQVGITVASLGLGMYGEHAVANWIAGALETWGAGRWVAAHTLASVLAIAALTYLHIVLGEMVPKSLALASAERAALWITPPMLWTQAILYPLIVALNAVGNGILRLIGIRRELSAARFHTPEELEYVVQESAEGGLLRAESGRVLRDLFDFGALTAGEVMVPRVHVAGLPFNATTAEVSDRVRSSRHTRYPVYERDLDHILGMVHIKDLFGALRTGGSLGHDLVRPVPFLPATAELDTVLAAMRSANAQLAVVMDEHGGTEGIVTLEDLFEEVVGTIEDSKDAAADIVRQPDGGLRVAGTVRLDEVEESLGLLVAHPEVETVSGLVLSLLGRPPRIGDAVDYEGIRFEVMAVAGRGVRECIVRRVATEPDGGGAAGRDAPLPA